MTQQIRSFPHHRLEAYRLSLELAAQAKTLSPENAMPVTVHKLQAYEVSLNAFAAVNEALDAVPERSGHGYLVTQCRRAVSSVVSNIAEGGKGPP